MRLIAQNNAQQRTVNFHAAVVINEAQFSKFVHEMAHTGGRRGRAVVRPQSCMVASIRPDVFRCGRTLRWWLDQGRLGSQPTVVCPKLITWGLPYSTSPTTS